MNCLEFRRLALADPRRLPEPGRAHAADCPSCQRFHHNLLRQDESLLEALEVDVPAGLADRVLLKRPRFEWPRLGGTPWGAGLALAATLVLGVGVGLLIPRHQSAEWLAAELIAHVQHEPGALENSSLVSEAEVLKAVNRGGGRVLGAIGKVTHAGRCPVPGGMGEHLVLETETGKVTVILMPNQPLHSRTRLTREGLTSVVLPAGKGSLSIVADSPQALQEIEEAVLEKITWI